jgi:hypothetical protein
METLLVVHWECAYMTNVRRYASVNMVEGWNRVVVSKEDLGQLNLYQSLYEVTQEDEWK